MSGFVDRWGQLTVEQIKELNEVAKLTCEYEATAAGGEE